MDWFLYDNGLRHKRVKENDATINNIIKTWLVTLSFVIYHFYQAKILLGRGANISTV